MSKLYDDNRKLLDQMAERFPDERRRDDAKIDALNRELAAPSIPSEDE